MFMLWTNNRPTSIEVHWVTPLIERNEGDTACKIAHLASAVSVGLLKVIWKRIEAYLEIKLSQPAL